VHDPTDHTPVIDAMSSASATRHQRLDPLPFRIAQPVKLFPHHGLLDSEALNHTLALAGIPYWVRTLMQQAAVELSTEGYAWLNQKLEIAFARYGKVPTSEIEKID
jgi:hypothetical protein